nr:unnamed protein product [Fasciola hepatica]
MNRKQNVNRDIRTVDACLIWLSSSSIISLTDPRSYYLALSQISVFSVKNKYKDKNASIKKKCPPCRQQP